MLHQLACKPLSFPLAPLPHSAGLSFQTLFCAIAADQGEKENGHQHLNILLRRCWPALEGRGYL